MFKINKAKEKLINELQELQRENNSLKAIYENYITELKLAQEALVREQYLMNALMNNLPDYIYFKDTESHFIKINDALAKYFGLSMPGEEIGKTDFDFFTEEHARQAYEDEQTIIQSGKQLIREEKETWIDRPDNWVSTIKLPLLDHEGNIVGTFGVSRDITARKRVEELNLANKELEAFSYSVSHDLRAPLRHINGYVDLLLSRFYDTLPDKARHYLDNIADSARQMGTLIDDLLQFSRTGRLELRQTNLDMNVIVQEVIGPIKQENRERNIEWRIASLPNVYGDHAMLRIVWTNLLSNALKFTRTKEKTIIEINVFDENEASVFSVCDNGVGFDMQYAQKLFGVFQRLHPIDEFEGTGIGLANVHRIILRHQGRTWANAEPDKGATFYFSIPKNKEVKSCIN